jgi:hypothetical protein
MVLIKNCSGLSADGVLVETNLMYDWGNASVLSTGLVCFGIVARSQYPRGIGNSKDKCRWISQQ